MAKKKKMPSAPIKTTTTPIKGIGKMGIISGGLKPEKINPKYPGSQSQLIQGILGKQG